MDSHPDKASGLKAGVDAVQMGVPPGSGRYYPFYSGRYRVYGGLLAFVVLAGLPLLVVPSLRHRLTERVEILRDAMAGRSSRSRPILVAIGQTHEQFPRQFEPPVPPPPSSAAVIPKPPLPQPVRKPAKTQNEITLRIPQPSLESAESRPSAEPAPAAAEQPNEPIYRQGNMEREAYDVILQSSSVVAGMVRGENASLSFQNWSAAKMDEDIFWVRLAFTRRPENTPVTYIWQVKLLSKEVTALSYEARSLPKP